MTDHDWSQNVQANVHIPADEVFGVTRTVHDGIRTSDLTPFDAARGVDGLAAPGMLFMGADIAIGGACIRIIGPTEVIVTTSLHMEIHRRPFESPLPVRNRGAYAHRYHGGAAGSALLVAGEEPVATVTGRFAVLDLGARAAGNIGLPDTAAAPDHTPMDVAPVDPHPLIDAPVFRTLGTRMGAVETDSITVTFRAAATLANERSGVHGGVGAMMGERAIDILLRAVSPDRVWRPVSMSAAFFRPVAADGADITCSARIEHAGRRLTAAQAILSDSAGKPAVIVDLVAAALPG